MDFKGDSYCRADMELDACLGCKRWNRKRRRMKMNQIEKLRLHQQVERILHVPGNYRGGILEMAFVLDYHISKEVLMENLKEILAALRTDSKVFQNVRLNLIKWVSDTDIRKEVSSVGVVQMGRCLEDYKKGSEEKSLDELTRQLKLFYARSKLIIWITDGAFQILDSKQVDSYLKPFLQKKLLKWEIKEEENF